MRLSNRAGFSYLAGCGFPGVSLLISSTLSYSNFKATVVWVFQGQLPFLDAHPS